LCILVQVFKINIITMQKPHWVV